MVTGMDQRRAHPDQMLRLRAPIPLTRWTRVRVAFDVLMGRLPVVYVTYLGTMDTVTEVSLQVETSTDERGTVQPS